MDANNAAATVAPTGYDADFHAWTQEQARTIREAGAAGLDVRIDWENVAEEIESLGRSDVRALRSHIETLIEHLLKLEWSPVLDPRHGWIDTVIRARREVDALVDESSSLHLKPMQLVTEREAKVRSGVAQLLLQSSEIDVEAARELIANRYQVARVLDPEWFPARHDATSA